MLLTFGCTSPHALVAVKLSDLGKAEVQDFADGLRQDGMSPVMVKKILASLGAIISEAMDRGLVARNAVKEISSRRKRKNKRTAVKLKVGRDIPEPGDVSAIIANAKGRWRPLLMAAAFTGLRASELRGLRWADVDLKASKLHVTQRADKFHKIGVPEV